MSVLDQFRDAEERVLQRLKELEPAVAEYRELEQVARRLGLDATTPNGQRGPAGSPRSTSTRRQRAGSSASKASTSGGTASRRRRRRSASPGQRAEQLLAVVRARPGVTVAEVGKELGVDPTSLYRIVHRLEEQGELRKNARKLEPAKTAG